MKNPWDVVSGLKHDNRLKCHRGIVSQWTFQVGLNVTLDETWVDVTSRHRIHWQLTEMKLATLDVTLLPSTFLFVFEIVFASYYP